MSSVSHSGGSSATGQGSNSANVRLFNERVILTRCAAWAKHQRRTSSRYVRLTNNTAGVIVKDLEERKLIRTEGKRSGGRGQPATLLRLSRGRLRHRRKVRPAPARHAAGGFLRPCAGPAPPRAGLPDARGGHRPGAGGYRGSPAGSARGVPTRLAGIGIATSLRHGQLAARARTSQSEAYSAWNEIDIVRPCRGETGLAVFCENDGTAAAVAEMFRGHGRELTSFVYVFIGAAIGGGIVLNGDYYRGTTGNAGDIGLMPVQPSSGLPRRRSRAAPTKFC